MRLTRLRQPTQSLVAHLIGTHDDGVETLVILLVLIRRPGLGMATVVVPFGRLWIQRDQRLHQRLSDALTLPSPVTRLSERHFEELPGQVLVRCFETQPDFEPVAEREGCDATED